MRLITGAILIVAASCLPGDTRVTNRFENVQEAREAGLFARGWLPDVLPAEAGPIEERHDVDTNARCSRSYLPKDTGSIVLEALSVQGFVRVAAASEAPPWDACPFTSQDIAGAKGVFSRRSDHGTEFAALDDKGAALIFWSHGS